MGPAHEVQPRTHPLRAEQGWAKRATKSHRDRKEGKKAHGFRRPQEAQSHFGESKAGHFRVARLLPKAKVESRKRIPQPARRTWLTFRSLDSRSQPRLASQPSKSGPDESRLGPHPAKSSRRRRPLVDLRPLRGASGGDGAARGDALPSIAVSRRTRRAGKGKRSEEERRPQAFPPLRSPCVPCPEKSCRETSLALQAPLKDRAPSQAHASFRRKGGGEGERPAPQLRTLGLRPRRRGRRGRIVPMQPTGFFTCLVGAAATWGPLLGRLQGFSDGVDTRFGASLVPALIPNDQKMKAGQANPLPGLRFFWSQRADSNR